MVEPNPAGKSNIGRLLAAAAMALCCATASVATAGDALDPQTRVDLQMTLKEFIDGNTRNGTYPFFDVESGAVKNLKLKNLHPVIFKREGHFMMCADFVGEDGADVLIDYIVVPAEGGYAVEQQILGRRSYLKTLFDRVF